MLVPWVAKKWITPTVASPRSIRTSVVCGSTRFGKNALSAGGLRSNADGDRLMLAPYSSPCESETSAGATSACACSTDSTIPSTIAAKVAGRKPLVVRLYSRYPQYPPGPAWVWVAVISVFCSE
ncbi:Uncharacterised protein [Mycobacterium tuberculosis]|nr:Uncharacterised protein [Mycobacterium tuberculosis]